MFKFVLPHFDCFVSDMEWLVDITDSETNEEGRFFWSLSIIFVKLLKRNLKGCIDKNVGPTCTYLIKMCFGKVF